MKMCWVMCSRLEGLGRGLGRGQTEESRRLRRTRSESDRLEIVGFLHLMFGGGLLRRMQQSWFTGILFSPGAEVLRKGTLWLLGVPEAARLRWCWALGQSRHSQAG